MSAPTSPVPLTLLVSRRVAPSRRPDFLAWLREGERRAARFPGFLGCGSFAPPDGDDTHQILFRFADEASLARWAASPERCAWLKEGADLVRESRVSAASGTDGWFAAAPPPRWKQAVTIWLVFFPVSLGFSLLFGERLAALPVFWRVLLSTLSMTPVMVFVFIPLGTRLLRRWLQAGAPRVPMLD